ncbi:hypothetical protein N7468_008688 [Penicillium chermesinum]|uniref:RhoGAP-domain-containing protein n=1 Tax=Penicillium chermesinum TaxID=63820 RepID=A0A9W9NQ73_9EURO|nr:uncharacterized protein N7468_008688 [Penicillium chermesinum]KAJ5224146.1 hypothetical protein N7468_008688 [Penicillium chermesinum]
MSQRGEDDLGSSGNPPSAYPPLNSGRMPRDYASRDVARSGPPGTHHISPSPLHTSSFLQSSSHDDSPSSQSPVSAPSSANPSPSHRSPISHIANAPFPAPPRNSLQYRYPEPTPRPGNGSISKQAGVSEPDRSASSSVSSVLSDRPAHRIMPRTSSIDSAISSLSSVSQKSNFDASALSPADIGNIINAAGSAEAVIVHLLREKHQAASQNSQLWKLVDKQRTLILGLNKDLERAYKEKEKYRKKLKEVQDSTPPLPTLDTAIGNATNVEDPRQIVVSPSSEGASSGVVSPVGSDGQRLPAPSRKPPPAPLNLRPTESAQGLADPDSGSEYSDGPNGQSNSNSERGRRKTREEDDRDREVALHKDIEAQGSVKEAQFRSTRSSPDTMTSASPPTAPRELTTRSPPNVGASGSLGSILNSRVNPTAANARPNFPNPKSPGLPMSRKIVPSIPLTQNASRHERCHWLRYGLPLSPRPGNHPPPFPPATIPTIDPTIKIDSPHSPRFPTSGIYQGLVSDEYPGLLLPPNALPLIQVRVSSSRLRPSRNSYMASRPLDEEPVFTLSVISRSDMSEFWRVEKVIASLPHLDQQVRQLSSFAGRLPDRNVFNGHSPAKVDARRAALNAYFDSLLDTPMDEKAALVICQFLTSDAIEPRDDETSLLNGPGGPKTDIPRGPDGKPRKEGYLTKRGKNFGGWKARYFVLHGPELKYFESPGGPHMGTIKLFHAQIGKQSQSSNSQSNSSGTDEDADNQYRHAFLVLEPKRKDSSALVRHVLCAESDDERDSWVDALMEYVDVASDGDQRGKQQTQSRQLPPSQSKSKLQPGRGESPDEPSPVQGFSFDNAIAAEPPIIGSSLDHAPRSPRMPAGISIDSRDANHSPTEQSMQSPKIISGPTNGAIIQDAEAWGNKTTTSTKEKKRSIWGFRTRSSSFDLASQAQGDGAAPSNNAPVERKEPVRPVFGIPLAEAVRDCPPLGVDVDLPAVVYRCIEYLRAKDAALEEGIFRLSGSNVIIKALKERFNTEGDLDFISSDQYYDVHAVASLFKQYLRELPTTVLTRELHLDFLRVLELDDKQKKVAAFNSLVHQLPKPNLSLLRALSLFLIEIVNNSDVNKMPVRNVGIVFAPTLNIPAPVVSLFLTDFDSIFGSPESSPTTVELTVDNSLSPDDVRSPRQQMFTNIPTPSYNQTSFGGQPDNMRSAHDVGLVPMQPNYDPSTYRPDIYNQNPGGSAPFGSLNSMLSPSQDDTRSAKSKRRESSMLFMESR